ncbi:MAG: GDSL family lipase, partial [Mucilaginibacter sp.]
GDGRHPEEVFIFFQQLVVSANNLFGDIPCYFVSLKPSISRQRMIREYAFTNNLIKSEIIKSGNNWHFIDIFNSMLDPTGRPKKEYYLDDGLHLSAKGYLVWKEVIASCIAVNH